MIEGVCRMGQTKSIRHGPWSTSILWRLCANFRNSIIQPAMHSSTRFRSRLVFVFSTFGGKRGV
jgi:hypothetical protein